MRVPWILLIVAGLAIGSLGADARAQSEGGGVLGDFLSSGSLFPPMNQADKDQAPSIIRTDFDLTGDGVPEVFLSWPDSWTRNGFLWVVYEITGKSSFQKLGTVRFNDKGVRVTEPGSLRVLEPQGASLFWLVDYSLLSGKLVEVDRRELTLGDESGPVSVEQELAAMRQFWKEHHIPSAWADLSDGTLSPWKSSETHKVLHDLAPIAPGFPRARPTPAQPERGDLQESIQKHQPCAPPSGCGITLELRNVTGDGEPELLLRTSSASPHLVYSRVAGGLRFLGELPLGLWRLDEDGRLLVLRDDPMALEVYRVTSEGIVRLERVLTTSDPKRVKGERNRMARKLLEIQSREDQLFFSASWEQASAHPSDVHWVTFRGRKQAEIDVELSMPVSEPQPDNSSEK